MYVGDMVVKRRTLEDHLSDIQRIFDILDKATMRLNSKKCTFGVKPCKSLGYIVFERGIKANSEKIKAIQDMDAPKYINDIQN